MLFNPPKYFAESFLLAPLTSICVLIFTVSYGRSFTPIPPRMSAHLPPGSIFVALLHKPRCDFFLSRSPRVTTFPRLPLLQPRHRYPSFFSQTLFFFTPFFSRAADPFFSFPPLFPLRMLFSPSHHRFPLPLTPPSPHLNFPSCGRFFHISLSRLFCTFLCRSHFFSTTNCPLSFFSLNFFP